MAALPEALRVEVVNLTELSAHELQPLFAAEIEGWRKRFAWDFRPSADLLTRYVQLQSLYGCALRSGSEIVGYSYLVIEGRKGLLGDFFVAEPYSDALHETLLLRTAVDSLMRTSGIRRVEAQLMFFRSAGVPLPFSDLVLSHQRVFMQAPVRSVLALAPRQPALEADFVDWSERRTEDMAHLLAAAYRNHVDSEINDQYRTVAGARHFLNNIVRYPGCGTFSREGSVLAYDRRSGRLCGACLTSMIANTSGHITQLCVLPALRNANLGYELLRRAALRLKAAGAFTVSLTVTCSNMAAIRLYQMAGFEEVSRFPALVWEGWDRRR